MSIESHIAIFVSEIETKSNLFHLLFSQNTYFMIFGLIKLTAGLSSDI